MSLLVFIKTKVNNVFEIHPPLPWNNLNRLSIGFSYLKNKFGHDIEDCIEPICNGGKGAKTTNQFFRLLFFQERFNTSCFYARTKKMYNKRLRNQGCELELGDCKNCGIGDSE